MPAYLLRKALGRLQSEPRVLVALPSGAVACNYSGPEQRPDVEIRIRRWRAVWRYLLLGSAGLCEAYIHGEADIEGEKPFRQLARLSNRSSHGGRERNPFLVIASWWQELRQDNSDTGRAKRNAEFHYHHPAEFFRLVTGDTYGYTESYCAEGKCGDLDKDQRAKFEYIAKKLFLKPGMRVVEVGSGWGYMACHMAEKYGADVTNYGIVDEQNRVMREMARAKGLEGKVRIAEKDHRELAKEREAYDRYVSIGVYEHAGKRCQREWVKSMAACLKQGGVGVVSFLGFPEQRTNSYFVNKHIFPGSNLPSLAKTLQWMAAEDLRVLDVENLWHHYAAAVAAWDENFTKHWERIRALDPKTYDESFRRTWKLYLEGCSAMFETDGWACNVFHVTFAKGGDASTYPQTRDFLYRK